MTSPPLNIIYMGTPDFAVPALEKLITGSHKVIGVYTQPPRPKGRGMKTQPSPIHEVAASHNIPVFTPKSLKKDPDAVAEFVKQKADIAVVAAYGLILPKEVLEAPRFGCLNIHASLLPRWRGASPIQRAIWAGDEETGIAIMKMDEGLDTGPVITARAIPIQPDSTAQNLHDDLVVLGGDLIAEVLDDIASKGAVDAVQQEDDLATYASLLTRDDGRIDWAQTAEEIDRQVRALTPWPGVWTQDSNEKRVKIIAVEHIDGGLTDTPGTLIDRTGRVSCGSNTGLRLLKIQPENSKAMDVSSAVNGGYLTVGNIFR